MATSTFPQIVYDIDNTFGNDISLSASNDLLTVSEGVRSQQRVLRRLLTTPLDYVWEPTYGAGLGAFVGQPLTADLSSRIKGLIISQIFLEPSVSKDPAPEIFFQQTNNGIFCEIKYTVNPSRQPTVLTFNIP